MVEWVVGLRLLELGVVVWVYFFHVHFSSSVRSAAGLVCKIGQWSLQSYYYQFQRLQFLL